MYIPVYQSKQYFFFFFFLSVASALSLSLSLSPSLSDSCYVAAHAPSSL